MPDFEIHADYDGDGRISLSPSEYALRRNGLEIFPNLDADTRTLPALTPVPASIPPATLDWELSPKPRSDDELVRIVIRRNVASGHAPVFLRTDTDWRAYLRVYDSSRTLIAPRRRGLIPVPSFQANQLAEVFVDLRNVAFGRGLETNLVPLSLVTPVPGQAEPVEHDSVMLRLRPLELCSDRDQPLILFVAEITGQTSAVLRGAHNEPTLRELRVAARLAGVRLMVVPFDVNLGDAWLQDQLQFAYLRRGNSTRTVVIHLSRVTSEIAIDPYFHDIEVVTRNLREFVDWFFPSQNLGVFRGLYEAPIEFLNSDQNLETLDFPSAHAVYLQLRRVFHFRRRVATILGQISRARPPDPSAAFADVLVRDIPELIRRIRAAGDGQSRVRELADELESYYRDVLLAGSDGTSYRVTIVEPSGARRAHRILLTDIDNVYDDVSGRLNSLNFGGNIEVAPATVPGGTRTLVIGSDPMRPMGAELRNLLTRSEPGSVFRVDTSWLEVGHVDEVLSFVPERGGRNAVLIASPRLAGQLLQTAFDTYTSGLTTPATGEWLYNQAYTLPSDAGGTGPSLHQIGLNRYPNVPERDFPTMQGSHPLTRMFRGKSYGLMINLRGERSYQAPHFFELMMEMLAANNAYLYRTHAVARPAGPTSQVGEYYERRLDYIRAKMSVRAVLQVDRLLMRPRQQFAVGSIGASAEIERLYLDPIRASVNRRFPGANVHDLPVMFDLLDPVTSAFTMNVVNLQQLGQHLIIPRPYGPRMAPADAIAVVQRVAQARSGFRPELYEPARLNGVIRRLGLDVTIHWANSFLDGDAHGVAAEFRDGFAPDLEIEEIIRRIVAANPGKFMANGFVRPGWQEVRIPEGRVDLFELYIANILDSLGATIHWVDSWYYHTRKGELHCGTNVLRAR